MPKVLKSKQILNQILSCWDPNSISSIKYLYYCIIITENSSPVGNHLLRSYEVLCKKTSTPQILVFENSHFKQFEIEHFNF